VIADLTSADLTAAPADCLTIFQDRLAAEQRRVACLQAIVHELQEIEQAQARLQALLEGRLPEAADAAPAQAARPVAAAPLVHEPRSRGRGTTSGGGGPHKRPGRHLDRAMEVLARHPDRRFSARELANTIGADPDWLRFVLHSAANRGLVRRHSSPRLTGARGRPVAIEFSAVVHEPKAMAVAAAGSADRSPASRSAHMYAP
jgi:hypothetical protein